MYIYICTHTDKTYYILCSNRETNTEIDREREGGITRQQTNMPQVNTSYISYIIYILYKYIQV
jgi:hypothetical protein